MIRSAIATDRRLRRGLLGLAALLLAVSASPASAEPSNGKAIADALFKEGKKLFADGKIPEACRKLEGSYAIDAAPGTLLNLAVCHEAEKKTATAWSELNEALSQARKANRPDREKIAKEHLAALEPHLARVVAAVPDAVRVPGLEVRLDGVVLAQGAWGTPIPVDPGDHAARVTAPEREPWEGKVSVDAGQTTTINVPALKVPPPPPPKAPPPPPPVAAPWKLPVGVAALGVGAVGLGLGTVFGARALSLGSQAKAGCTSGVCNQAGYDAYRSGSSAATASDVLFAVGVAAAAAGAVLLITRTPKAPAAPASALSVYASPAGLGGTW